VIARTVLRWWEATAPRDPDDPALSNDNVPGLAWYHTSTYAEWPSPGYGALVGAQLQQFASTMPAIEFARMVKRAQTKALHVGTYESAIENMLRRMHDQDDANSDFYLHRVALRLPATAIPDGYRHQSHEDASDLTLDDLGEFLAVRYLNVREAPGSFSLAIHPDAIGSIQTLALPQETLAPTPLPHVIDAIMTLDEDLAAARAAMPDMSGIDPMALRMRVSPQGKTGTSLRCASTT
jgi:hypothetical protein